MRSFDNLRPRRKWRLIVPIAKDRTNRTPVVGVALVTSLTLLTSTIVLLGRARNSAGGAPPPATTDGDKPRRFTLRLGQGFRLKDGAVVANKADEQPDLVFKYLPPYVGGLSTRYNPISQQVETGFEPTLTSPMPLIVSTRINAFDARPDVARITTGDIVGYFNQAPIAAKTRYLLLMTAAGDQYLLTMDQREAPAGRYDDWRIGFSYEAVQLPLGLAGGKINKPLVGKLIYRDWYRTKVVMRLDLATGKEEGLVDGILPSFGGDGLLGFGDASSAYVVRDASGKTLHTIRFNDQVLGPLLSPDGKRLLATVYRPGPPSTIGGVTFAGAPTLSVAVFDLSGREITSIVGYDDATWTPDGKVIATGKLYDAGLFEIDPATKRVRAIDAQIGCPLQPAVSPDGKTIAFVTGNKVWLIDRDGKNLRQLMADGQTQQRPSFSPDGTKVAFIICNQLGLDASGEVFVIDLKTKDLTPVRTSTGASIIPDTMTRLNWVR
jgi:hypothetical protein